MLRWSNGRLTLFDSPLDDVFDGVLGEPDWEEPLLCLELSFSYNLQDDDESGTREFTLHSEEGHYLTPLDSEREQIEKTYRSVEQERNHDNSMNSLSRA